MYREVMRAVSEARIPFAVGGGMAAMGYADQIRESKDLDLYIQPELRPEMIALLTGLGFRDYYDEKPYQRHWIYRSIREDFIVDAMWAMANNRASVTEDWLGGPEVRIDGLTVRLLPPEHTLWTKLYVLQRDRCDWPDALSMLAVVGSRLDWNRMFALAGEDAPLLGGLLSVFGWLAPVEARALPEWIWDRARVRAPEPGVQAGNHHALLDTRPWFTPVLDCEHRLSEQEE